MGTYSAFRSSANSTIFRCDDWRVVPCPVGTFTVLTPASLVTQLTDNFTCDYAQKTPL